ncbi:MAG: GGDEF domain-containing protein [Myxococcota bacterium]
MTQRRWPTEGLASGVDAEPIREMLRASSVREAHADAVLAYPGEAVASVYWVVRGSLSIHLDGPESPPVALVEEGSCAGELAALHKSPRSAWIVAHRAVELYEIPGPAFLDFLWKSHQAAMNLLLMQSERVRASSVALLSTVQERDKVMRNALVDPLTNLRNRRWIDQMLPRLLQRALTDGEPLSVVLADVDHFKRFNDEFGHDAGDHVLNQVALHMRRRFRPGDHLVRFGGEEFVAVLPMADREGAFRAAERLRTALEYTGLVMPDGRELPRVTLSAGVAEARPGDSPAALLKRADQAMYEAKRSGRNRIVVDQG